MCVSNRGEGGGYPLHTLFEMKRKGGGRETTAAVNLDLDLAWLVGWLVACVVGIWGPGTEVCGKNRGWLGGWLAPSLSRKEELLRARIGADATI